MHKLLISLILIAVSSSITAATLIKDNTYHEKLRAIKIEKCIHNSTSWCKKHLICKKGADEWCELKYRFF